MIVRPWKKGDTERIDLQDSQAYMGVVADLSVDMTPWADAGLAWTGEHEGVIVGCAGLLPQWEGRAIAWAMISRHAGPHFPVIHKAVMRILIHAPYRRIETTVDIGFPQGVRWMKMLGFELEGYMKAYRPDGEDMLLFARVRR